MSNPEEGVTDEDKFMDIDNIALEERTVTLGQESAPIVLPNSWNRLTASKKKLKWRVPRATKPSKGTIAANAKIINMHKMNADSFLYTESPIITHGWVT